MLKHNKTKSILLFALIFFLGTFGSFNYFTSSNWYFAYEEQPYLRCLPYELSLVKRITLNKNELSRNKLVVVNTKRFQDFYSEGRELLKVIVGIPGDTIDMRKGVLSVNSKVFGTLMSDNKFQPYMKDKATLKEDEYFVIGTSRVALDSRIIGPVSSKDIIGYGYAIF